ncbi:hypothetical protein HMPREF1551_01814, partial [Capnocytophaga sp. oral taxon 863 str. F0517]
GRYISEDPIGFLSGEPNFFAYVSDTNAWVDLLGLNGSTYARDRLMQHMRNDHLLVKDLDSLTIINMNDKSDKEVLMKEATTIKEHGGIGDPNVANKRRPEGTDNIAKKNS